MKYLIILMALMCPALLKAQQMKVTGSVVDTAADQKLAHVVVSFLKQADSTLIAFGRTDKAGHFTLSVPQGQYIVLVTSPYYADFVTTMNTDGRAQINMKQISVISKARLLEEIIVTQQAIRMKGDTTEYLADSFKVKPNASVEDLLKELPGIQVDKDGRITAQGQTVQKILVDGDEFFSDDPTIATRNLRADAIKKVQVFDKKSDQAEFTGIDDGEKTRTINLELKEDAKNGYFGKLAAAGLDRYYNLQAMINAFKAKRKLAAFAIGSSTSETGLDWSNAGNYGFTSGNVQFSEETGGVMISSGDDDGGLGSASYSGTGLPESIKAGLHYSNKWNDDKLSLGSNYLLNDLKVRSRMRELSENIIENAVYYTQSNSASRSDRIRHELSGLMEITLDSTSSVKIDARAAAGRDIYNTNYFTENISEENSVINRSNRNTQTRNNSSNEAVNALYRKRLKRPGQTISVNLSQSYQEAKRNIMLYNESMYFDPISAGLAKKDTVDQNKLSHSIQSLLTGKASYTQPLSASSFLVFDYAFTNSNSRREDLTYDLGADKKYQDLSDSLSNKFGYIYNIHNTGVNYRFAKGKISFSAGGNLSITNFYQRDYFSDTAYNRDYINLYPRAQFSYKISPYRNLNLSYTGNTTQPTINQIQPLVNNLDPLSVVIGNPDLKQSFTNSVQIFFTDIKVLTERYIFVGARASLTNNEINESYYLDNLGRRISRYENTDGNYSANLFAMLNTRIPKSIWRLGVGPLVSLYRYTNYVNFKESITNTSNVRLRVTAQGRIPEKLEFNFSGSPAYNISRSNISRASDREYWSANLTADINYQLPAKMEIGMDVIADFRQKITAFDNNNNIISWNAYIEKRFMKNQELALRASMFDILDQNKGYSRYQLGTGLQEQRYLTWGQYGLISLTYNFVKKGSKGPADAGGGFRF